MEDDLNPREAAPPSDLQQLAHLLFRNTPQQPPFHGRSLQRVGRQQLSASDREQLPELWQALLQATSTTDSRFSSAPHHGLAVKTTAFGFGFALVARQ